MANHAGKEGLVTVAGNTVAELTSWSVDESASTINDTELIDTAETFLIDKTSWTGSIEAHWDETDTTAQGAMTIGASVTVVFKPEGASTGDYIYTGTGLVTGIGRSASIGGMVSATFTLQGTGTLVQSTHA